MKIVGKWAPRNVRVEPSGLGSRDLVAVCLPETPTRRGPEDGIRPPLIRQVIGIATRLSVGERMDVPDYDGNRLAQNCGQVPFNVVTEAETDTVTAVTVNAAMRGLQPVVLGTAGGFSDVLLNRCSGIRDRGGGNSAYAFLALSEGGC